MVIETSTLPMSSLLVETLLLLTGPIAGGLLRNQLGEWIARFSQSIGDFSVSKSELRGLFSVCVELDSKAVVDSLSQEVGDDPSCCSLVLVICELISRPWQFSNWFIPTDKSSGTTSYKQGALETSFAKDPKLRAIEFVLKDGCSNRWMKLNNGNSRVDLPNHDENTIHPPVSKDLIQHKVYLIWESKDRRVSTAEQQKHDYDDAMRALQNQLIRGTFLNDLQSSCISASTNTKALNTSKGAI
ncbi:alpha-glucan water dikinase, chloroplast precursor, putative [Ricinus communis]|uniref:Alpha-glucan water dikinase, chloroplast, putative n=1 Tax=Ricinus communis TaxID=3988 RepID=B9RN08_RICCO|nr:alpha-glucan water dikinase, chloroplast precursor, putative [Ricinus communis]